MALKVDNLNNLFWDNGSYRFPNTYPHLVNGKWLEKTTPVMLTPTTGWVVLTGDFNYCEFKGELFFLRKDQLISLEKNKWRYILIKDHVCSIFKNKANVLIKGTLTNGDLEKLNNSDFQFTFPVFNSYNQRILLPLAKETYNWKKHIIPILPTKKFGERLALDNADYSKFLTQLENNKTLFKNKQIDKYKHFSLLGRAKLSKKQSNWKDELLGKIKQLLNDLGNEDVVLVKIEDSGKGVMHDKYAISYKSSHSLGNQIEQFKQVLNLDFSKLEDIVLVSPTRGEPDPKTAYFRITPKKIQVTDEEAIVETYIKKLSRRPRVSFFNKYSTRAIYERTGKLQTWYATKSNAELFLPQKIFFKVRPSLLAKPEWSAHFPTNRKIESFRSAYLYYCQNLDFIFKFKQGAKVSSDVYSEATFIDSEKFLTNNSEKSISKNLLKSEEGVEVATPLNPNYYPWKTTGEPLNIGWLIGQFSLWVNNQDSIFDQERPYLVKKQANSLHRLKGLNKIASKLIQNQNAYEPTLISEEQNYNFELDIFNTLPARARQSTQEADFLIGEKMLFSTWGAGSYLLFQPADSGSYLTTSKLSKDPNVLISKWLSSASYYYPYYMFDDGSYTLQHAKEWFKKAYDGFKKLDYKRFYENKEKFKVLKEHIKKNTKALFITEEVSFKDTPIKELKEGDIFFSDLDYFFYDHSEGDDLEQKNSDWFTHEKDAESELEDGEIVVYTDPKDGGLSIGAVNVWKTEVVLPEDQFIAEGNAISSDSSVNDKLNVKLTKISRRNSQTYKKFDEVINVLSSKSEFFSEILDFNLEELAKTGSYLFDLKGTDFYCYFDQKGKVHLIFKKTEDIQTSQRQIYTIKATDALNSLDKTQWVNQKVNLSIFGQKIDLPVKVLKNNPAVNIELETAELKDKGNVFMDSHKVEISHSLGKTYLRFDTPKILTKSSTPYNAYETERMDISNMRAFQDYLIKRKEYEIGFDSMEIEHAKMRFDNQQQKNALIARTIVLGLAGAVAIGGVASAGIGAASAAGGIAAAAKGAFSLGGIAKAGALLSAGGAWGQKLFSDITGWSRFNEQTRIMEEKIALSVEKQLLNSYTIDLSEQRRKEDYLFNLRRSFAQESFNAISSRERNQALDDKEEELKGLSNKEDKEIYLELWTISDKQKEFAQNYHSQFGVDCRVGDYLVPFANGIKKGLYKLEDVQISNLNDRIDLLLIKSLLENGIKIEEWIEHEQVKELIPIDPKVAKLQEKIEDLNKLRESLENEKKTLEAKIQSLISELKVSKDEEEKLTVQVTEKQAEIKQKQAKIKQQEQQIATETQKYHTLSNSFRELETKKAEQERLAKLYLEEKSNLAKQKSELEAKNKELDGKIEQINAEIKKLQQEKEELTGKHGASQDEVEKLKNEKQQIQQELEETKKSLEAVREIETNLRNQLAAEGKAGGDALAVFNMMRQIAYGNGYRSCEDENYFPNQKTYLIFKKGTGFDIVQWSLDRLRWEKTTSRAIHYYPYFKSFAVTLPHGQGWSNYLTNATTGVYTQFWNGTYGGNKYGAAYHTDEIKTWSDIKSKVGGKYGFLAMNSGDSSAFIICPQSEGSYFPYFPEYKTSGTEPIMNDIVQNAGGAVYFDPSKNDFVSPTEKNKEGVKKITTYGEYLRIFGLRWANNKVQY